MHQLMQDQCVIVRLHSMGTVLWEICTGDRPCGRQLRRINVPEEAPQGIYDLIKACHSLEPSQRPTAVTLHNVLLYNTVATQAQPCRSVE